MSEFVEKRTASAEHEQSQASKSSVARAKGPAKSRYDQQPHAAGSALDVASRILHDGDTSDLRPPLQSQDIVALWELHAAATQCQRGVSITASAALALLDNAVPVLMQARDFYLNDDNEDDRVWVDDYVLAPLTALRGRLQFSIASDRVDQAVMVDGKVFDVGEGASARNQGGALRVAIAKLVPVLGKLNDLALLPFEEELEHQIEKQIAGHLHKGGKYSSLLDVANALFLVDGYLTLTDEELKHRRLELHGIAEGIVTYAELVKGVTEFVGGCAGLTMGSIGLVAKLAGETDVADMAIGASRIVASSVGSAIAVIEVATELAAAVSAKTTQEKVEHGLSAAAGAGLLAAKKGASVGFAASTIALDLGFKEAKLAATLYWDAAQGIVQALMTPAFEELRRDADGIAAGVERVIKAQALVDAEQDPDQRASFERVLTTRAEQLGGLLDELIGDIAAPDLEADMARHPGAHKIFVDVLAPVRAYKNSRTPIAVMTAAAVALSKLTWIFANAAEIRFAATTHGNVADVERIAAKRRRNEEEKEKAE